MVWARHEDGRRSRSGESDDESDTGEKEERETKDKVEGCVQEGHADCRTERESDEGDRAYWKETTNNHSGDPRWREQPEEKKKKKK